MPCVLCGDVTKVGNDLVTKIKRGVAVGKFVHMKCAIMFYEANPIEAVVETVLQFKEPSPEITTFLNSFVAGEAPKFYFKGTAGVAPLDFP